MDAIHTYLLVALASKLRTHVGVSDWQHLVHTSDGSSKGVWDGDFWLYLRGYNVGNSPKFRIGLLMSLVMT